MTTTKQRWAVETGRPLDRRPRLPQTRSQWRKVTMGQAGRGRVYELQQRRARPLEGLDDSAAWRRKVYLSATCLLLAVGMLRTKTRLTDA